ncbi:MULTISPECIES: phosphotransferase [unclassified Nocardioides]|uniref:phosphotransferase n=1 Tax=unclassified Nocardioides TaxID=2615069 RepID=UPI000056F916|nr:MULTISPECIES: phosphotransferase [unclassified Nocardioides]ABL82094.1 Choline/ethanolamine kinase [Nocardioides sp. JS614]
MDQTPALDRLACLAGRSWRLEELPGGLTNVNLHVVTEDRGPRLDLVVRCSQGDPELLGIDRDAEAAHTEVAAATGVAAGVVEYRPDLGLLVIEFLEGKALVNADFADPGVVTRAAASCRVLHAGPAFGTDFDMFARQADYLRTARDHGYRVPADYEDHADAWADVRRALAATPHPRVPCNNDLLAANFIDDGDRVWLIDYEYSGNNEAAFELGNTATECGFSLDQVEAYVAAYFGSPTPADLARVRLQMLCSEYGWSLWGFIQEAVSPIEFDFHAWGMERYEKAVATFRGPDLAGLLADVAQDGG